MKSLFLIAIGFAFLPLSGCFNPCGNGPWQTGFTWKQQEIFDDFPPEGMRAGYTIEWHTPSDDPQILSSSKHAEKPRGDGRLALLVDQSAEVSWFIASPKKLVDQQVWSELNQTFSDLALPHPSPGYREIHWGRGTC